MWVPHCRCGKLEWDFMTSTRIVNTPESLVTKTHTCSLPRSTCSTRSGQQLPGPESASRKFAFRQCIFLSFILLSIPAESVADDSLLRWKFQPGELRKIEVQQTLVLDSSFQDLPIKISNEMGLVMTWRVELVDPEQVAHLVMRLDRLRIKLTIPERETVDFDSASDDEPAGAAREIARNIGPLIGLEFRLQLNARGEILSFSASEEAADALAVLPSGFHWKEFFSKDGIRTLVGIAIPVLPEQRVSNGACWSQTEPIASLMGRIQKTTKCCYAGRVVEDGRMLDRIDSEVNWKLSNATNPLRMKALIKHQRGTGMLLIDPEAGILVRSESSHLAELQVTIDEKSYPQTVNSDTKVTVVSGEQ